MRREIGAAIEFAHGESHRRVCFGTYREDFVDPGFRFRLAFVEHSGFFRMHAHEYCELAVVLGGRGTHLTESGGYPLELGEVFVISPGQKHGFENADGLRLCNVMFDQEQFLGPGGEVGNMRGVATLFGGDSRKPGARFRQRLSLPGDEMVYVRSLLARMRAEYEAKEEAWKAVMRSMFVVLVAYLCRRFDARKEGTGTPVARMAEVMGLIRERFRERLTVGELAAVAGLSTSQLQRRFRSVYGQSPMQFVTELRMQEACELLKKDSLEVGEIGLTCGYSSSSFFATQFRKWSGETPSGYRGRMSAERGGD